MKFKLQFLFLLIFPLSEPYRGTLILALHRSGIIIPDCLTVRISKTLPINLFQIWDIILKQESTKLTDFIGHHYNNCH